MATVEVSRTAKAGGKTFTNGGTTEVDGTLIKDPSLPAAKTGTLSTRSSDTAGTLTMASGHGITDGDIIDIYWSGGQCTSALVGTVATNSVPFTLATGDVLPAATTAITAMVQVEEDFHVTEANLKGLFAAAGAAACSVTFYDGDDLPVGAIRVKAGTGANNRHYIWDSEDGSTAALTDDCVKIGITHGDGSSARVVNVVAMTD